MPADNGWVSLRPDDDARTDQRPRRTRRETRWARAERQAPPGPGQARPCRRHVSSRRARWRARAGAAHGDGGRGPARGPRRAGRCRARAEHDAGGSERASARGPRGDGCLPLPPPVACAAGMPAARNIPVRAWSPVGTGHDGALGLSYSASDEVKYRRLSLARVHACLSMLGSQRIGGVNGIFATSRCMCHCVRQDLISVQFYCTVTTAYLVTELSIIGTNLMVRSFPSSLLIMFLPYQQFC